MDSKERPPRDRLEGTTHQLAPEEVQHSSGGCQKKGREVLSIAN